MKVYSSEDTKKIRFRIAPYYQRCIFALSLLFSAFGFSCLSYARQIQLGGSDWLTGEWLINYSSGFVRRGLVGEVYRNVFPEGQLGLWCLFIFQCSLYALLLSFFINYLIKVRFSWPSLALVCSPASFAFIGWDSSAFARKESLGFVSLVIIAIAAPRVSALGRIVKYVGLFFFIVSIFASEINFIMLPSVIYLLIHSNTKLDKFQLLIKSSLVSVVSMFSLIFIIFARGSRLQGEEICESLTAIGLNKDTLCSGAISALGTPTQEIHSQLLSYFPAYFGYLPLLLLAIIPILTTSWFRKNKLWVLLIFSFSLPLYFFGYDYGRWIHMFIVQITILIIFKGIELEKNFVWNSAAVTFFVTLWGIQHSGYIKWGTNSAFNTFEGVFTNLLSSVLGIFRLMLANLWSFF
jgi:hypothetical protein